MNIVYIVTGLMRLYSSFKNERNVVIHAQSTEPKMSCRDLLGPELLDLTWFSVHGIYVKQQKVDTDSKVTQKWVASTKRKEESLSGSFVLFWLLTSLVKIETGTCGSHDLSWVLSMCVLSSVMTLSWLITRLLSDRRKILLLPPSPWWNQSWNIHDCVFPWMRPYGS